VRRALLAAAVLAVVLVLVAVLWFVRSLDARVARHLERVGSELLGTEVSVSSVDVELRAGRATVRGLEVANPRGAGLAFSREPALRVDEISVTLEPASLAGTPIVLGEVDAGAPFVNLEVTEGGGLNLLTLSQNLEGSRPEQADAAAGDEPPRRFRIRTLRIQEGTLRVDASAVGREVREIALGNFVRKELGGASGGTPGELGRQVLVPFLNSVLAKVATDRIGELLDEQLDQAKEKLSESLRSILGVQKKKE
jgi:hypothetical protein